MEDSDFQATRDAQKEWDVVFIGSIFNPIVQGRSYLVAFWNGRCLIFTELLETF